MSQSPPHPRPRKSHRLFRVLFVGLSLLMLIVLASAVTELAATDVRAKLDNALRLERDLGQLLLTLQGAETGQRGYLLTRREDYLLPYQIALDSVGPVLARVGREVIDDPRQQQRVSHVRDLIAEKFGELQQTINLKSAGDTATLYDVVLSDRGMHLMKEIRGTVSVLRAVEVTDITARQAQLARLRTATLYLRLAGVLGLAFVFYYIYAQAQPLFDSLTDTNEALALKNRELDQFAYTASHDLREPLRTVNNYVEVLAEDYEDHFDEAGRQHLSLIRRTIGRMEELIDSLLRYSRADQAGKATTVDLQQTVRNALENLRMSIEESAAAITVHELPTITGHPVALGQLFQNLIANAIKFRVPDTPPVIEIGALQRGGVTEISVKDHGIGIPKADQPKIFGLFARVSDQRQYQGQGIGLAMCQKIVRLHGGTITVASEPGRGSNFTVTLPHTLSHAAPEIDPAR